MLCQNCGQKPATVHLTKIVNNEKQEVYLCEDCARERQDLGFTDPFSFPSLISGLLNKSHSAKPLSGIHSNEKNRCKVCGQDYETFARTGKIGCAECYNSYGDRVNALLKRIHGSTKHTGKVPERTGGRLKVKKEIKDLQEELQTAVAREEYEQAAELRDKIRDLEKELED
ncbi:MAG: UvrB/UvrC motif-containing protein [Halanaerobium sp.]|nr:UvrB/UvrC motif-containing protein [Halanaerobium sp.]